MKQTDGGLWLLEPNDYVKAAFNNEDSAFNNNMHAIEAKLAERMETGTYDADGDGIVDDAKKLGGKIEGDLSVANSAKLGGQGPEYYATKTYADTKFPTAGGALTGNVETMVIYPKQANSYGVGSAAAYYANGYFNNAYIGDIFSKSNTLGVHTNGGWVAFFAGGLYVRNINDTAFSPVNASAFNNQSSKRYKKNIVDIDDEELHKIIRVAVKRFLYKGDETGQMQTGVIAEQLDEIGLTTPVSYDADGRPDAVDYSKFTPYLIGMVQEQQKRIDRLEEKAAKCDAMLALLVKKGVFTQEEMEQL